MNDINSKLLTLLMGAGLSFINTEAMAGIELREDFESEPVHSLKTIDLSDPWILDRDHNGSCGNAGCGGGSGNGGCSGGSNNGGCSGGGNNGGC